jgi:hypothetical protein
LNEETRDTVENPAIRANPREGRLKDNHYKPRKYGINLEFSGQPVYEWEVRGGRKGTPVTGRNWGDSADGMSDVRINLYNRTINCNVIYGKREYGINLVWEGGPRC